MLVIHKEKLKQDICRYDTYKKQCLLSIMNISYADYFLHLKWLRSREGDQLKKIGRLKGMTQTKNIALIPIGWDLAKGALTEQFLQQHAFA